MEVGSLRQNTFETEFLASLCCCLLKPWRVVIVADQGFQRTELLRYINELGFSDRADDCSRHRAAQEKARLRREILNREKAAVRNVVGAGRAEFTKGICQILKFAV